jgi:hypothetical protein
VGANSGVDCNDGCVDRNVLANLVKFWSSAKRNLLSSIRRVFLCAENSHSKEGVSINSYVALQNPADAQWQLHRSVTIFRYEKINIAELSRHRLDCRHSRRMGGWPRRGWRGRFPWWGRTLRGQRRSSRGRRRFSRRWRRIRWPALVASVRTLFERSSGAQFLFTWNALVWNKTA